MTESPIDEVTRILATWPEGERLAGVLRVVRAMDANLAEARGERDAAIDRRDRERESRKAAERERDAHRQHAIEVERARDARVTVIERVIAAARPCIESDEENGWAMLWDEEQGMANLESLHEALVAYDAARAAAAQSPVRFDLHDALQILSRVEWQGKGDVTWCCWCKRRKVGGHAGDCDLARLLREHGYYSAIVNVEHPAAPINFRGSQPDATFECVGPAPRQYSAMCRHALWIIGSCPECHKGGVTADGLAALNPVPLAAPAVDPVRDLPVAPNPLNPYLFTRSEVEALLAGLRERCKSAGGDAQSNHGSVTVAIANVQLWPTEPDATNGGGAK